MSFFRSPGDFVDQITRVPGMVFTNGCFDILHKGHIRYLDASRKLGSHLVIGLNSDSSIRRIKGTDRPVNNENDRAEVLLGLRSVDHVILFDEDTPLDLIRTIKPDFLTKGGDYKKSDIVGADYIESYGGKVVIIPFEKGYSTTGLISKITRL